MITFSLNPFERFPRSPRVLFLIYHFMPFMPFLLLYPVSYPWLHLFFPVCIPPRTCMLIDLVSFHRVARGSQPQPAHIFPLLFHSFSSTPTPSQYAFPTKLLQFYSSILPITTFTTRYSPFSFTHIHIITHFPALPPSRPPALPFSRFPTPLENQINTRSKYIWFLFSGVFNCLFSFRMFSAHISEAQLNFSVSFGALSRDKIYCVFPWQHEVSDKLHNFCWPLIASLQCVVALSKFINLQ